MTWWAIKGPDGEILFVDRAAYLAWSRAGFNGAARVDVGEECGYRCVEVELVEKGEPGKGRVYEALTDWIADLAMRDGGAVFLTATPDARPCPINYGGLRELLRAAAEAEGITESTAPTGGAESKEG